MDFETVLIWLGYLVAGALALQGLALQIVKRTATPADDRIVGRIYKALEFVAGILPARFKATIAMPPGSEKPRDAKPKSPPPGAGLYCSALAVAAVILLSAGLAGCGIGGALKPRADTPEQANLELLARYDAIQASVLGILKTESIPAKIRRDIRSAEQTARAAVLAHDRAITTGSGDRESLARAAVAAVEKLIEVVRTRTGRDLTLAVPDPPGRAAAIWRPGLINGGLV